MVISFFIWIFPLVALISLLLYAPAYFVLGRRRGKRPFMRHLTLYALLGYGLSLLYLTILWYGLEYLTFAPDYYFLNLKPFVWLNQTYEMGAAKMAKQLLLNIGMFVPCGLLLPMAFSRLRRFWKTAVAALGVTLCIETLQYFMGRSADIDDVIMNLAGGMLGYMLFWLCRSAFAQRRWWRAAIGEAV